MNFKDKTTYSTCSGKYDSETGKQICKCNHSEMNLTEKKLKELDELYKLKKHTITLELMAEFDVPKLRQFLSQTIDEAKDPNNSDFNAGFTLGIMGSQEQICEKCKEQGRKEAYGKVNKHFADGGDIVFFT